TEQRPAAAGTEGKSQRIRTGSAAAALGRGQNGESPARRVGPCRTGGISEDRGSAVGKESGSSRATGDPSGLSQVFRAGDGASDLALVPRAWLTSSDTHVAWGGFVAPSGLSIDVSNADPSGLCRYVYLWEDRTVAALRKWRSAPVLAS